MPPRNRKLSTVPADVVSALSVYNAEFRHFPTLPKGGGPDFLPHSHSRLAKESRNWSKVSLYLPQILTNWSVQSTVLVESGVSKSCLKLMVSWSGIGGCIMAKWASSASKIIESAEEGSNLPNSIVLLLDLQRPTSSPPPLILARYRFLAKTSMELVLTFSH